MYVRSVVWYAPAVVARRTSMALCRISTVSVSVSLAVSWGGFRLSPLQVFPFRMIPSSVPTNSVNIVSM